MDVPTFVMCQNDNIFVLMGYGMNYETTSIYGFFAKYSIIEPKKPTINK